MPPMFPATNCNPCGRILMVGYDWLMLSFYIVDTFLFLTLVDFYFSICVEVDA